MSARILLIIAAWLVLAGYIAWRGFTKDEFCERGRWGWRRYRRYSFEWCGGTFLNLMFLGSGLFLAYLALFHGDEFDREPVHRLPRISGHPTETVQASAASQPVALCIAHVNHGQAYSLAKGHWRVAVWNGRGADMYVFDIVDQKPGSRVDIYRKLMTPFVDWDRCLDGGGEPADGIVAQSSR